MEHKYEVRFAKSDPETPPTTPPIMEDQIALARVAARQLGVPNAESAPLYRVGKNPPARRGPTLGGPGKDSGESC